MRMIVGVVVLIALTKVAVADVWKVTPPDGWTDQTAAYAEMPPLKQELARLANLGGSGKLTAYSGDSGGLLVFEIRMPGETATRRDLTNFEAGARDSMRDSGGVDAKYTLTEDDTAILVDHDVDFQGQRRYTRRITGLTTTGLLSIAVSCGGTAEVCQPTLRSLVVDRTGFTPLAELGAGGMEATGAYRAGRIVGLLFAAAVIAIVLWSILKKRRS